MVVKQITDRSSDKDSGTFYGWKLVIALMVLLSFQSGLSFYNHSIILNALSRDSGFSVQSASLAVSLFFLTGGITGLGVARWIRDFDPRLCITTGAILCCLSLGCVGLVKTPTQLYLLYMLFGMGFSASGLIPASTLVTRWFHRKRAMALSIASTGLSLGGVVITPLCAFLVEWLGLFRAGPVMGALFLLGVIPVAWLWLRPDPQSMGLLADGDLKDEAEMPLNTQLNANSTPGRLSASGITFSDALKGRFFWAISLSYIFLMMAQVGGIAHQYGLAREMLNDAETALVVAIIPIASIAGRLIGGWLVERMSIRIFAIAMMVLQVLSLAFLAGGFSVLSLCAGLALFGVTVGNLLMLQPLLIAEAFGVRDYARLFSVSNLMTSWGTASGPALLGLAYGLNQNEYQIAYIIAALAALIGLLVFLTGGEVEQKSRT